MKIKKGLKFKIFYSNGNINNIDFCEIRGIVDDYIIVLWCEKNASNVEPKKQFYKSINKDEFDLNVENQVYLPIGADL